MGKRIICNSCGAEFHELESKCPYCGTMNYKGAELEYFEKLEDVREDLEELNAVPLQETKKEIKKQSKFIKKVLIIAVVLLAILFGWEYLMNQSYDSDLKADFIWKSENFPIMDEMYEAGQYEELVAFFYAAIENDKPAYDWEHSKVITAYEDIQAFYEDVAYVESAKKEGRALSEEDYTWILWQQLRTIAYQKEGVLLENERLYFAEDLDVVEQSLKNDWGMDEATYQRFYDRAMDAYDYVNYDECNEYVKEWLEKGEK